MSTEISTTTSINRQNPTSLLIKERRLLTHPSSTKQTFHVVLDNSQQPLRFKTGDSLGIYPHNDPMLVTCLLQKLAATGNEEILDPRLKKPCSLRDFLTYRANLNKLTSSFLELFHSYAALSSDKKDLEQLLCTDAKTQRISFLQSRDLMALLEEIQVQQLPLQELCNQFGPLLPRFYSIASSYQVHPDEIHLTVALNTFSQNNTVRYGVASHFLCSLAEPQITSIPCYIQPTTHFTLPDNANLPIILIGPGTGVAPFRAFIQERIASNASGKTWLFFGERHRNKDYLYEEELERWHKEGKIQLSLAFSREGPEKVYVQHLLLQQADQVWQWLQQGAFIYVCGDAQYMAKDVHAALAEIIRNQGQIDAEQLLKELKAQKRYVLDVY